MHYKRRKKYLNNLPLFFVIISISIWIYSCSQSRIERTTLSIDNVDKYHQSEEVPFLKLHMQNGDAYILSV